MRDIVYEQALIRHRRKMLRILDELKSRSDLTPEQHGELMKIIGFRNVLVHDYLDVNDGIVQAIVAKKQYAILEEWMLAWQRALEG